MKVNGVDILAQIEERICKLQHDHITLYEELKKNQCDFERSLDSYALKIIDILDMIEMIKSSIDLEHEANINAKLIIKKVNKRLVAILEHCEVKEIIFTNKEVAPGKVRVLETYDPSSNDVRSGTIIKVCRKGYQRRDKIIRPSDVITAG